MAWACQVVVRSRSVREPIFQRGHEGERIGLRQSLQSADPGTDSDATQASWPQRSDDAPVTGRRWSGGVLVAIEPKRPAAQHKPPGRSVEFSDRIVLFAPKISEGLGLPQWRCRAIGDKVLGIS
jgi:hypothetical protein